MARKRKLAAVVFSLGCLQAGSVWALGLGEMSLESFLNEPLKAKVNLLNTGGLHDDQIRVRLATKDDFDRLGVDRAYFLTGIKFDVRLNESGGGEIVLTSDDPVLEPYLDLIIETRWPSGRLLREYTVLVDPPAFDESAEVVSASQRVEEVEGIPAPSKKNDEAVVTRGDRVDVQQKSNLAPGAMPERDFAAGTAGAPAPGNRYMIRRDETLWEIAEAARPEGVSVHRTMLDIQRLNPDAFIGGNINRIKAGYIIYLPSSDEISPGDLAGALSEVKQQNEDWRAGRDSATPEASGPSLRISTDPQELDDATDAERDSAAAEQGASAEAALEDLERSELENAELQDRVDSLAGQVQTLENIVSVKDEKIAALQAALAEAQQLESAEQAPGAGPAPVAKASAAAVTTQAKPKPVQSAAELEGGWTDNLLYPGIAALVAAFGGLLLWRRRQNADGEAEAEPDVFAGMELKEQPLQLDEEPSEPELQSEIAAGEALLAEEELNAAGKGYGEHRHDHYADDVDTAGDALAEADIYIAYGRYPQAIELLRTALEQEPNNAAYRLKILELYAQVGRDADALRELEVLRELGDETLVARAEEVLAEFGVAEGETTATMAAPTPGNPSGASMIGAVPTVGNPSGASQPAAAESTDPAEFDLAPHFEQNAGLAEAGFSDLVIEDEKFDGLEGDLDLSEDFDADLLEDEDDDDGELVFATEGSQVSTKLDLARAYIDMGDEEGARQILDEVVLEDSGEHQQEAQSLLERIG
jgi:pilus assembly protein FimV